MTSKKWTWLFGVMSLALLSVFGLIMRITDPLLQYGKESPIFSYFEYSEMYSNPGIAKNYDYDAVLVGTSMIQNTDIKELNDAFGCTAVRLSYSGGTCYNMKTILDVCFSGSNSIKKVFWELDEFQLFSDDDKPRYPLPTYLYQNTFMGDLSYLLNFDIFYHYDIQNALKTISGKKQKAAREGQSWNGNFSKEAMLNTYHRKEKSTELFEETYYISKVRDNLSNNLIPLIMDNPQTEFDFFFVPFSLLYWDNQIRCGTFDALMNGISYAIDELLEYPNVHIFFYHDEWDICSNLNHYKDYTHYEPLINSYVTKSMADGKGQLTKENSHETLDSMKEYLNSFEFDSLFQ